MSEYKYKYGDDIVAESGKKSRGGVIWLEELRDLGSQLVSGEILQPTFKSKITIAFKNFTFNTACVQLFKNTQYVELIMDKPRQRLIALPSTPVPSYSVKFALLKENKNMPRQIKAEKLKILFALGIHLEVF